MKTNESQQILELYKFYVELTDRISQRRGNSNTFFLTIISSFTGLIAFISSFLKTDIEESIIYLICFFCIILCLIWYITINSYKQLNKLRFSVIQELEKDMIFPCFTREWEYLKDNKLKYYRLSKIEKFIPILFMVPFIFFIIISLI